MSNLDRVKSIVVLMLENRSLDNVLGYLYTADGNVSPSGDRFDGLTGNESNPNPNGGRVTVRPENVHVHVPTPDPGEEFEHVNVQLFGQNPPPAGAVATNEGFVRDYLAVHGAAQDIMTSYAPAKIPNIVSVCKQYAVCDAWFASVPTQTWANRAFTHAATSWGFVDNVYKPWLWQMPTIFDRMNQSDWCVYQNEIVTGVTRLQFGHFVEAKYDGNFIGFENFLHAANAGQLPKYSFVEPSFFHIPTTKKRRSDMHPPYDILPADELVSQVHNAVVSSPQWQDGAILLIVTFDEHGGCYDHVPPPANATPPGDGKTQPGQPAFGFDRFGVRVPAIVVSPFVRKGSVFRASGSTPYDHTSILATIERRFGIAALSKRDAAAPDLGAILTEPLRNDASPLPISHQKAFALGAVEQEQLANVPLDDLDRGMIQAAQWAYAQRAPQKHAGIVAAAAAQPIDTMAEAEDFFRRMRTVTGM